MNEVLIDLLIEEPIFLDLGIESVLQINPSGNATLLTGKSAYQIAVENGFIGTEQQWVNNLQNPDGGIIF